MTHITDLKAMKNQFKNRKKSELSFLMDLNMNKNDTTSKNVPVRSQLSRFKSCLFQGKDEETNFNLNRSVIS